jgi:8-oxo-dGTP pyrophosphatase MutT (NUDIX family)
MGDSFVTRYILAMTTARANIEQVAVIPIRNGRIGLITSRSGKRWVVPKGCIEPDKTSGQVALLEAWEEAGWVGVLGQQPVGAYLYKKCGNTYHVTVFPMHVTRVANQWPELSRRRRCWVLPAKARALIEHRGLRDLIAATMTAKRTLILRIAG